MRSLKYYVASTLDGFIAHSDHTIEGFIGEGEVVTDYLAALKEDYEIALMGRKTYEFGLRLGVSNPYPWMRQYVFSRTMESSPDPNVHTVSEAAIDFVQQLKQETGKAIYLCGGANLATALFAANLVDEIILKLNPILFGAGISLFSKEIQQTKLELINRKTYESGVVLLHYHIKHGT
jgi:dihydrofolate reductase